MNGAHSPFSALITNELALGTTETAACRFWIVSWTVTRSPFQSPVALAMSSPTFLGDCWGGEVGSFWSWRGSSGFSGVGKDLVG
jgi:hypothetical protein